MALKAESDQPFDERDLMNAIWSMVYQLFGEFGASQTALSLVKCNDEKKVAIVRCSHKALDLVRAAVAAVTEINGKRAVIRVVAVSGTLKALRKKLLRQIV
ncbi:MAG: Rpp14/Pop5 family protein [Candidatus Bathyarchaeota archaeon]|nr:Rpp14/Pop5 family protein [Candidatus Bathyarchaeota archaeon]